jgi:Zn-dependent M28 family amino/carboxypeptidase
MAPHVAGCENGLMLCLFGAEEWALAGSRAWLAAQPAERLARMRMNLNLDSVAGHGQLTALTSGFAELPDFLCGAWPSLAVHEPLMANSDHANFAALGVPAARIIAGFNAPQSNLRFLLTAADRALTEVDRKDAYVWIAAESAVAKALRARVLALGFSAKSVKAAGYWRLGGVGAHEVIED